ncbi:hypothetical protein [Aeromonas sp. 603404]|uniref:hypothetical protein n=1 Tax=Aeromonas sp. 603404 TaxID=2712047 RepID=UPI003B9EFD93
MSNKILFVFEGEKTECEIAENLFHRYFPPGGKEKIISSFCGDVYSLYSKLQRDDDLDIFSFLKETPKNQHLRSIKRREISEIYLFFDYDGHATAADDKKLKELIDFFCEETEKGKIYINYPMVESLKHINISIDNPDEIFKEKIVSAKNNIKYKKIVGDECSSELCSFKLITELNWNLIMRMHLCKANHIVENNYILPRSLISQENLFAKQMEDFILPSAKVSVVSSFPLFFLDYFGLSIIEKIS